MRHRRGFCVLLDSIRQQVLAKCALQDYILHYLVRQIVHNALPELIPLQVQYHASPVYRDPIQMFHRRAVLHALWGTTQRLVQNAKSVNLEATRISLGPQHARGVL